MIEAEVVAVTLVVETVNVLLVAPAGTVTLAGTDAELELSASDTTAPPPGAAPLSVTVPVEEFPPTTLVGLRLTAVRVGPLDPPGVTRSPAVHEYPVLSASPEMMTSVVDVTAAVVMGKVALVAFSGTTTLEGTVATAELYEASETMTPPGRAALSSVAVPVDVPPPATVAGFNVSEAIGIFATETEGFTVSTPLALAEPKLAVSRTLAAVDRGAAVYANIELVSPG